MILITNINIFIYKKNTFTKKDVLKIIYTLN